MVDCAGDLDAALSLYERNTRLSEALYTPLQSLEICLRNTLDEQMSRVYGDTWMKNGKPPLHRNTLDAIEASDESFVTSGFTPSHGDLVAELKFSFWVSLVGFAYDNTLWRKALFNGFKTGKPRKRTLVHGRLNAIRRFRNRVAHHEPIYAKADQMNGEIIEAIGWMCPQTKEWTEHHSRFPAVLAGD